MPENVLPLFLCMWVLGWHLKAAGICILNSASPWAPQFQAYPFCPIFAVWAAASGHDLSLITEPASSTAEAEGAEVHLDIYPASLP